jgi:hypothetical protein
MRYSILVLYQSTNLWLTLAREERANFFEKGIGPIVEKFAGHLAIRLFDSEAFHANISDFMLIECADFKQYYFFMEHLRDSDLFSKPYIIVKDIVVGVEGGFQMFEQEMS